MYVQQSAWYVEIFETRYESNFVCPAKLLSEMRLSEEIPFKTCANPPALGQNINWRNVYENEMV